SVLPKKAEAVFDNVPAKELTGNAQELRTVRDQLLRHLTKVESSRAESQLAVLAEKLIGKTGPVSKMLRSFIGMELGSTEIPAQQAAARYAEIIAELRRIESLTMELAVVRDLAQQIEDAGAPKLAARIRSEPVATAAEDKIFPMSWHHAWNWARM